MCARQVITSCVSLMRRRRESNDLQIFAAAAPVYLTPSSSRRVCAYRLQSSILLRMACVEFSSNSNETVSQHVVTSPCASSQMSIEFSRRTHPIRSRMRGSEGSPSYPPRPQLPPTHDVVECTEGYICRIGEYVSCRVVGTHARFLFT